MRVEPKTPNRLKPKVCETAETQIETQRPQDPSALFFLLCPPTELCSESNEFELRIEAALWQGRSSKRLLF